MHETDPRPRCAASRSAPPRCSSSHPNNSLPGGGRPCAPSICARAKPRTRWPISRSAQQAYVAAGQGVAFWMPKVDQTLDAIVERSVDASAVGHGHGGEALARRSRHHARRVQHGRQADPRATSRLAPQLMAADIVFTEGGETAVDGGAASRGGARIAGTSGSRCRSRRRGATRRRWRSPEPGACRCS